MSLELTDTKPATSIPDMITNQSRNGLRTGLPEWVVSE